MLGTGIGGVWYAIRPASRVSTASAASCVLSPEQIEGPFYVGGEAFRSDITEDRAGIPLKIRVRVQSATTCKRIAGATVEVWHTDAGGAYSGINGAETAFLRGQQTSDGGGRATFQTIYPGWYIGRTAHIHVKVHLAGTVVHTGQLYFDDAVTDAVYAHEPYASRGPRTTTNASDGIYAAGGARSKLTLRRHRKGYRGRIVLGVHA